MLNFWDMKIITWITEETPHLEQIIHECSCDRCSDNWDVEWYECSVCWFDHEYLDRFIIDWERYKCPKCEAKLVSWDEVETIVRSKQKAYNTENLLLTKLP